ncbi:MAG: primosomal protein N' [Myxococcota bacterium]
MTQLSFDTPVTVAHSTKRARVVVNAPVGLLDYRIPPPLFTEVQLGKAVTVPLRQRRCSGYIVALVDGPPPPGITLKDIDAMDNTRPDLPPELIDLLIFTADYYCAAPGEVFEMALPPSARSVSARYRLTKLGQAQPHESTDVTTLLNLAQQHAKGFTVVAVERAVGWDRRKTRKIIQRLMQRGWLERTAGKKAKPRSIAAFRRCDDVKTDDVLSKRHLAARALLQHIPSDRSITAVELTKVDRNIYGKLRTLENLGLIRRECIEQRTNLPQQMGWDTPRGSLEVPTPTPLQADAISQLTKTVEAGTFATFLLQGVTGSGKTEIYLRTIECALNRQRTALILVPEIALTPQLGAHFRSRFGNLVATFHSGLTAAERRDEWERVATGEARIGLGARSAVFLPLRQLGVIIVDEEHETSFKQEETPRYNARDLAVYRGRKENACVILGSATPALESRFNADQRRYRHILLPQRVHNRPMPEVTSIDLAESPRVGDGIFTATLAQALEDTLRADQQAIIFLNRRGFAPYIFCRDCGFAYRCDECDVSLTLHRKRDVLLCHYCGFEMPTPEQCPSCEGLRLDAHGLGTERVQSEIEALFGTIALARLDRDTVKRRGDIHEQLRRFRDGEAKILIGTQMVTKGHDFPGVTLVGVVSADASLNFPDFRAAERTFQLLTQVAGRAGRGGTPGRVFVQAYETQHYAIVAAGQHDYEAFAEQELEARRELLYPPYSHLALLRFEGSQEGATRQSAFGRAESLRQGCTTRGLPIDVLGPAPSPIGRLRGLWRFQILLRARERAALHTLVRDPPGKTDPNVRCILDIDPINML